ncbi:protein LtuA [Candidatus Chlamydia sanziniae]|uniref:Uncharacterized protein n=1 Tax=Candidatus Chlamydia sanziniae TaxID=1806891 RepID=A0A1A9HUZ7_9CHLA|nr:protein LtuA [Candidatus Chlamydia sanziniae]ANH78819.1 hypothetical protein Cs308_0649 [Candidatus Chlamydia sanziniae]
MFFIRACSQGFLDVYGILLTRKGKQVVKSSSHMWVGTRSVVFYRLVS